jgi:hypothetical protein
MPKGDFGVFGPPGEGGDELAAEVQPKIQSRLGDEENPYAPHKSADDPFTGPPRDDERARVSALKE